MSRIKYYYDTEKCRYERVNTSIGDVILSVLGFVCVAGFVGFLSFYVYYSYYPSPQVRMLSIELEDLKKNYVEVEEETDMMRDMMIALNDRDKNVYRIVTGADTTPPAYNFGRGGAEFYQNIRNTSSKELIEEIRSKIDSMKAAMYSQTKSYDEIIEAATHKEEVFTSMPAIQPVSKMNNQVRLASGFGVRQHPILKVYKMHTGLDFAGPIGTPIYATGDGTVKKVEMNLGGYGKMVTIDHGFGYVTRYAHMQRYIVKAGEKVKRGQVIGYLGNTGRSTGPHVHYEVKYRGKHVNPVHYFFQDLNAEEYEEVLKKASEKNQSLS